MIRGLLHLGPKPAPQGPGSNKRGGGRVRCEGIKSSWGEVVNASATGCRIITRLDLHVGVPTMLTIETPDGPVKLAAKVVWARKKNWGKQEVGVQFVEVDPAGRARLARLAEFASRDVVIGELSETTRRPA